VGRNSPRPLRVTLRGCRRRWTEPFAVPIAHQSRPKKRTAAFTSLQKRYQSPIANGILEISAPSAPHPPLTSPNDQRPGVAFSFRIPSGTGSKHLYTDETSGDVALPIPHPKFPLRNHFDLWLSTQSITSTTPTIPPVSTSTGTEIPCFVFIN